MKTKLHVSLDRVLQGNKYHVSRCRVSQGNKYHVSRCRVSSLRRHIQMNTKENLVSICIFRITAM
jgi:hypothetical protein